MLIPLIVMHFEDETPHPGAEELTHRDHRDLSHWAKCPRPDRNPSSLGLGGGYSAVFGGRQTLPDLRTITCLAFLGRRLYEQDG